MGDPAAQSNTRISVIRRPAGSGTTSSCLVQLYGPELGRKFDLDHGEGELTIGREDSNFIVVDLDNVSRRHAMLTRREGQFVLSDLASTNGTHLNDQQLEGEKVLSTGDRITIGGAIFKFLSGDDVEALFHEEIYRMTINDGLTRVHNRRYFVDFLEREMGRCHRYGRALSLMMIDLDNFKAINDQSGHLAGDHVLREVAQLLAGRVRREECFARFGGEEFVYVLPELGAENARTLAEKLRRLVEDHPFFFEKKKVVVTISIGVADLTPELTEPDQFIKLVDERLYAAKRGGRNRVEG